MHYELLILTRLFNDTEFILVRCLHFMRVHQFCCNTKLLTVVGFDYVAKDCFGFASTESFRYVSAVLGVRMRAWVKPSQNVV